MYAGIHINNTSISAAITDENGKTIMVEDESAERDKKFINPLQIYIEDEFAYLGDKVNYLLANNQDLNYASGFLTQLEAVEKPVYKDVSGLQWNAAALIAVFLKKLKTDILVYNDIPVKQAAVTLPEMPGPGLIAALKQAFEMAAIPLAGVLPMEKAALEGYAITNTINRLQQVLLCYLDAHELILSLSTFDEDDTVAVVRSTAEEKLGERHLHEKLGNFLKERYQHITGKKIREQPKSIAVLDQLVLELMTYAVSGTRSYTELLCAFDEEIIEMIVTKEQVNDMIRAYVDEIILLLREHILSDDTRADAIDMILLAGNSGVFPVIEQHLKTVFPGEEQKIYNSHPEEILTKGTASCATAIAETLPEMLPSETENTDDTVPEQTNGNAENAAKPLNMDALGKHVENIHINAGSETTQR